MPEMKIRLNVETEEVEFLFDNEVAFVVEKEVIHSWVDAINDKRDGEEVTAPPEAVPVEDDAESAATEPAAPDEVDNEAESNSD